jgi:DNA (cytosine-5)-methyltransferase 1
VRIIDLFCGTGGFSKGFENADAGFSTRFGVDLSPVTISTFQANHPDAVVIAGDVRKIQKEIVTERTGLRRGDVEVIIGGPPCQGFSSIRPFRSSSEEDPRNSLFREYAAFVDFFRPPVFVLENVVGLATHNRGQTVAAMEKCLRSLGYETDWKILNAAHFGVPQKRERLIMIGAERGIPIIFPKPTHECDGATIGIRDHSRIHKTRSEPLFDQAKTPLFPPVTVMDAISDLPPVEPGKQAYAYRSQALNDFQRQRRIGSKQLELHDSTAHTPKMLEIIRHSGKNIDSIPRHLISSGFSSSYSRLAADEPSVTITVNFVHPASNRCIHPLQDRALTPREGARLQSFDDSFKFSGNRTQIVKQIGNAVPPLLGRAIAEGVAKMLGR